MCVLLVYVNLRMVLTSKCLNFVPVCVTSRPVVITFTLLITKCGDYNNTREQIFFICLFILRWLRDRL